MINPAAGIGKIGGRFRKDGAPVLANPMNNLCNLSIKLSKFHEKCKIVLLKPLLKKGSKLEEKNYRPISHAFQNQTQTYLDRNNIPYRH